MAVEIKFCGMTRVEDARAAVSLAADFIGVIFAGGPRTLTESRAAEIVAAAAPLRAVGVFGAAPPHEVAAVAQRLGLHAAQLHGDPDARTLDAVRRSFDGEVWPVLRLESATLPGPARELFDNAEAVVLDAKVPGTLGGTGVALPWDRLVEQLATLRNGAKLVLAGGLRPENVATAIRLLRPDVVDVSSGVETAPGIKDRARMRAFRDAVLGSE